MLLKIIHTIVTLIFISLYIGIVYLAPSTWWYYLIVLASSLISQRIYYKEQVAKREFIKSLNL